VPPALVAVQVNTVPAVSVVTVDVSQPDVDVTVDSGSDTAQLTVTSLTYQPLLPDVPVTVGETTGGVESAGATTCTVIVVDRASVRPAPMPAGFETVVVPGATRTME
jgi:hypothetical protein